MKKNIKYSLVSVLVAFALIGCGESSSGLDESLVPGIGGGDSGGGDIVIPVSKKIFAIDGYLEFAMVCADRNNNQICESDEELGNTKSDGSFIVSAQDVGSPRLVKVISGVTKDADNIGTVSRSYTMISDNQSEYITPFTTLAYHKKITLNELANQLGIEVNNVKGDYVANKIEGNPDAIKAHFIARSLAQVLPVNINEINEDEIASVIIKTKEIINKKEGEGVLADLINKVLIIDSTTGAYEKTLYPDLNQYLTNIPTWTNSILLAKEKEVAKSQFVNNTLTQRDYTSDVFLREAKYEIDNNKLIYSKNEVVETDSFIYKAPHLAISADSAASLIQIWNPSDTFTEQTISKELFAGKIFYSMYAKNKNVDAFALHFNKDGTGYQLIGNPLYQRGFNWSVQGNKLVVNISIGVTYEYIFLTSVENSNGVMLVHDKYKLELLFDSMEKIREIFSPKFKINWPI